MDKVIIETDNAPKPGGPYSQGIKVGNTVYVAGFVAFNPKTGKVEPGGIKEQTKQVMENLKGVLEASGSSMKDVVKTTVYLTNVEDFAAMNEVFKTYFPQDPPVRTTVEVKLPLPELLIEIDVIACMAS